MPPLAFRRMRTSDPPLHRTEPSLLVYFNIPLTRVCFLMHTSMSLSYVPHLRIFSRLLCVPSLFPYRFFFLSLSPHPGNTPSRRSPLWARHPADPFYVLTHCTTHPAVTYLHAAARRALRDERSVPRAPETARSGRYKPGFYLSIYLSIS